MCVLLISRLLRLVGSLDSVKRFNHTSLVTIVTPIDRPKSVRTRCLIEVFGGVFGVFCVVTFCSGFSVGVRVFVIGLSQISSFFSSYKDRGHVTANQSEVV